MCHYCDNDFKTSSTLSDDVAAFDDVAADSVDVDSVAPFEAAELEEVVPASNTACFAAKSPIAVDWVTVPVAREASYTRFANLIWISIA
jgi:hypothetical protein